MLFKLLEYRLISKKGEGAFSEVLKAQSIKTGKYVAIKCLKNYFDSIEKVNNLREIQALRKLSPHPHVIKLLEVLYDEPTGRLALVFELMDMNMYEAIKGRRNYLSENKVKHYMFQLLKAIKHMHKNGIFHRDIKPENILIIDDTVKLADFGSCRGIYSKPPFTEYISTRWYRAPECLLTDGYYGYKMDMWGFGCVFFEILSLFPLFPGNNELDQINKIHNILGTPNKEILDRFKKHATHMEFNFPQKEGTGIAKLVPHISPECLDIIEKLLAYNPDERLTAKQTMKHPYFRELYEHDKKVKKALKAASSQIFRGTLSNSEMNSDNQSVNENPNNISQNSNNTNFKHINININANPTINGNSNMNVNINLGKKKNDCMLPEIKSNIANKIAKNNTSEDESGDEQNLPPISKYDSSSLKQLQNLPRAKKNGLVQLATNDTLSMGSFNNIMSKKIQDHKKSYVSPYSQKAIVVFKKGEQQ